MGVAKTEPATEGGPTRKPLAWLRRLCAQGEHRLNDLNRSDKEQALVGTVNRPLAYSPSASRYAALASPPTPGPLLVRHAA